MNEMWEKRYADSEYAYGTAPNAFFKQIIDKQAVQGKLLLPAEGEGRNAAYAAQKGWDVYAFDISIEGKKKAEKLAEKENVQIHYEIGDFFDLALAQEKFDAAALIYAHFPPDILLSYHQKVADLIKPNGLVLLEGFSQAHLSLRQANSNVGGPNRLDMLFSEQQIQADFANFEIIQLTEEEVYLTEGIYHQGRGMVIRFVGRKLA